MEFSVVVKTTSVMAVEAASIDEVADIVFGSLCVEEGDDVSLHIEQIGNNDNTMYVDCSC